MTAILLVHASPRLTGSVSRRAGEALAARLRLAASEGASLIRRDLVRQPPSPVDAAYADAVLRRADERAASLKAFEESEMLIAELEATDSLVITTPMHNYTVPAVLKAWIDQVLRIGRSFHRTPQGKRGLLADRPTFVIVASGGVLAAPGATQPDFLTPYLSAVLATVGITGVTFAYLDGLAAGHAAVEAAEVGFGSWMRDATAFVPSVQSRNDGQLGPPGIGEEK